MVIDDIVFPALFFSQDKSLYASPTADPLKASLERTVKSGYYSGLIIVDSIGKKYVIEKAVILHGIGPFWGYRDIFLNRIVCIQVTFKGEREEMPVEMLKKLFSLSARSIFSGGDPRYNDALSKSVKQANTTVEVVNCIIKWLWRELEGK